MVGNVRQELSCSASIEMTHMHMYLGGTGGGGGGPWGHVPLSKLFAEVTAPRKFAATVTRACYQAQYELVL